MYTNNSALSNAGLTSAQDFTVSFDIRSFGTGDLFSFGVGNDDDWKKIMLTSSGVGENLTLKFYGNSQSIDTGIVVTEKPRTEWTTITIVGDDSVTKGVKLYVNGILKGAFDMTPATNWLNNNADGFQFAGSFRNEGTKVDFDGTIELDNLLVYKTALTADEVKSLIVPVPEPTTATLSLLALAGLAARRRRK
jgi:MYXO-CTERM domain-containing protein